jgi:hypothetical protein
MLNKRYILRVEVGGKITERGINLDRFDMTGMWRDGIYIMGSVEQAVQYGGTVTIVKNWKYKP